MLTFVSHQTEVTCGIWSISKMCCILIIHSPNTHYLKQIKCTSFMMFCIWLFEVKLHLNVVQQRREHGYLVTESPEQDHYIHFSDIGHMQSSGLEVCLCYDIIIHVDHNYSTNIIMSWSPGRIEVISAPNQSKCSVVVCLTSRWRCYNRPERNVLLPAISSTCRLKF